MLAVAEFVRGSSAGLPRLMPAWGATLWVAAVAALWWLALDTALGELLRREQELPAAALQVGVIAGVAGKLVGSLGEAAFYWSWWALRGVRVSLGVLWLWLLSLSLLDTFSTVAGAFGSEFNGWARVVMGAVANGRLLLPATVSESHLLASALGGISAIAVARVLLTGWVLSRATRRSIAGSIALTFAVWLATRGLLVVFTSLLRGQAASLGISGP